MTPHVQVAKPLKQMVGIDYATDMCAAGFTAIAVVQIAAVLVIGGYFAYVAWSLWRRAIDGTLEGREGWYELGTVFSGGGAGGGGAGGREREDFEEVSLEEGEGGRGGWEGTGRGTPVTRR